MRGLVEIRTGNRDQASKIFKEAIRQADALLGECADNYYALQAKGLASLGAVVCDENWQTKDEAIDIYRKNSNIVYVLIEHATADRSRLRGIDAGTGTRDISFR